MDLSIDELILGDAGSEPTSHTAFLIPSQRETATQIDHPNVHYNAITKH